MEETLYKEGRKPGIIKRWKNGMVEYWNNGIRKPGLLGWELLTTLNYSIGRDSGQAADANGYLIRDNDSCMGFLNSHPLVMNLIKMEKDRVAG